MSAWTRPYYGYQHLGDLRDQFRATVVNYGRFTELHCFIRGVSEPVTTQHDTAATARAAGEAWLAERVRR